MQLQFNFNLIYCDKIDGVFPAIVILMEQLLTTVKIKSLQKRTVAKIFLYKIFNGQIDYLQIVEYLDFSLPRVTLLISLTNEYQKEPLFI